eukprot:SAG31_NODE_3316_length_4425_cov_3.196024_1_plen_201_part_00
MQQHSQRPRGEGTGEVGGGELLDTYLLRRPYVRCATGLSCQRPKQLPPKAAAALTTTMTHGPISRIDAPPPVPRPRPAHDAAGRRRAPPSLRRSGAASRRAERQILARRPAAAGGCPAVACTAVLNLNLVLEYGRPYYGTIQLYAATVHCGTPGTGTAVYKRVHLRTSSGRSTKFSTSKYLYIAVYMAVRPYLARYLNLS